MKWSFFFYFVISCSLFFQYHRYTLFSSHIHWFPFSHLLSSFLLFSFLSFIPFLLFSFLYSFHLFLSLFLFFFLFSFFFFLFLSISFDLAVIRITCNMDDIRRTVRLAVVGGRGFKDYERMKVELDGISGSVRISCIVSGGAMGADRLAERYARERRIPTEILRPDWSKDPRGARDREERGHRGPVRRDGGVLGWEEQRDQGFDREMREGGKEAVRSDRFSYSL